MRVFVGALCATWCGFVHAQDPASVEREPATDSELTAEATLTGEVDAEVDADEGTDERPAPADPLNESATLFMERTHFGMRFSGFRDAEDSRANRDILFEGSPALHLFIWNSLNDYTLQEPDRAKWWQRFAWSLTFNPEVRMLAVTSEPVRAPSWRVRANVQHFTRHHYLSSPLATQITGLRLSLGHYSNGQEWCSFQRDRRIDRNPECETYPATQDVSAVNRDNGDFSLNHATLAVHHRLVHLRSDGAVDKPHTDRLPEHRSHAFGLIGDVFIPKSWMTGGISESLAGLYGDYRVRAEYRYERTLNKVPLVGWRAANRFAVETYAEFAGGFFWNEAKAITQRRAGAELAWTFPGAGDLGPFVSFFWGNDYYNLLFVDDVNYQVLVGIVGDLHPRPHYHPGSEAKRPD